MLDRIVPSGTEVHVLADSAPVGAGVTVGWEASHEIILVRVGAQEEEVFMDTIHPKFGEFKPVVHLRVGVEDGETFEDELGFLSFLEAETVDCDSADLIRGEETVEDMSISATLDSKEMFVSVGITEVVSTFGFVLMGAIAFDFPIPKDSVHFPCYAMVRKGRQVNCATYLCLIHGEAVWVGGVFLNVFQEHIKEAKGCLGFE